jgi:hypothetical protein
MAVEVYWGLLHNFSAEEVKIIFGFPIFFRLSGLKHKEQLQCGFT